LETKGTKEKALAERRGRAKRMQPDLRNDFPIVSAILKQYGKTQPFKKAFR
jgi:hypothetical protein